MKLNSSVLDAFEIAIISFDSNLVITEANDHYVNKFAAPIGGAITDIIKRFKQDDFDRDLDTPKGYRHKLLPKEKSRSQFYLHIRRLNDGFIGIVQDDTEIVKSEALVASYSLLIEQQNREIIQKNKQIETWRNRIEEELDQAAQVQDLLVPKTITTENIISRCQYLREMSGDFHELISNDDGTSTMIIGDVAGKGIYAAIMLAQTLTAFRSCHHQDTLTAVTCSMIEMLDGRFPDGLFVALTLVRQSADKQQISILNLGNPAALVIGKSGEIQMIDSIGPAIGVLPAVFYQTLEEERVTLTDKRLLVFSDGIIDINLGKDAPPLKDSQDVADHVLPLMDLFGKAPLDSLFEKIGAQEQEDDIVIAYFKP